MTKQLGALTSLPNSQRHFQVYQTARGIYPCTKEPDALIHYKTARNSYKFTKQPEALASLPNSQRHLPVCRERTREPTRGAKLCPGLERRAEVPKMRAETACCRLCNTKSSSTRSLITRDNSLQVPSVNTRLLQPTRREMISLTKSLTKTKQKTKVTIIFLKILTLLREYW